jgi:hypothetical protein
MATRKQLIAAGAGVAVVGILSYLGYRVVKQINDINFDDFLGENVDDLYNYRTPNLKGEKGPNGSTKSGL